MPFVHSDKKAGDLIRSADWNAVGAEVMRLGGDKISRVGEESLDGPLTVRGALAVGAGSAGGGLTVKGDLSVGTASGGAALRVLKKQEDGKDATHGALVLGTDAATSAALRIGYFGTYSWLQGQGQQTIAINPHGGNVGIGTAAPGATLQVSGDTYITGTLRFGSAVRQMLNLWGTGYGLGVQSSTTYLRSDGSFAFYKGGSHVDAQLDPGGGTALLSVLGTSRVGVATVSPGSTLSVNGNATIGTGYAASAAPANGLLVQGNVGIGVAAPVAPLHVVSDMVVGVNNGQRFIFHTRQNAAGDFLQITNDNADGGWNWNQGITLQRSTGNVAVGTNQPQARLHVAGGALRLDKDQEIVFADNGQIRSSDNNHRILFRRTEDKMEFREYGSIVFSPGATSGTETAKATLLADGSFQFGNGSRLQPDQGGSLELGGNNGVAGTGVPYIDFHYNGKKQDYNTRIINDGDGVLSVFAGTFAVKDCFAVSLACADFLIGHPTRRKTPGRALVDGTSILYLNYDSDWSGGCQYWTAMNKVSTREIKQDIEFLDGTEAASLLKGLDPVRYRLIADPGQAEHLGFIAEEVPDAIAGPDHKSINESHIVAVLTRVVKEQQRRLDELTERLDGRS